MLDDLQVIAQRDPQDALGVAGGEYKQLTYALKVVNAPSAPVEIQQIIVTGMGGSALAAGFAKNWLDLPIPFEIVRRYDLPNYVGKNTLVIASSYSGNTEETLSAYQQAVDKGAQVAVIASGGKLLDLAAELPHSALPSAIQPRMAVFYNLKALILLLESYGLVSGKAAELEAQAEWLATESRAWWADRPTAENQAKKLAEELAGKVPVIYAGSKMGPVAYKWKISVNENAKNVAFANELPEFNHNEFIGWSSHPIEKAFGVVDLISTLEHPQVLKRFQVSDELLSGMRPPANMVNLKGEGELAQMLWGCVMGDFVSIYLAILNGVNPTPVELIEKLKVRLASE